MWGKRYQIVGVKLLIMESNFMGSAIRHILVWTRFLPADKRRRIASEGRRSRGRKQGQLNKSKPVNTDCCRKIINELYCSNIIWKLGFVCFRVELTKT